MEHVSIICAITYNGVDTTKNREHAERRALIEAERAARRKHDEELARAGRQKKRSSSVKAKWYYSHGLEFAGRKLLGGMFYAGSNMEDMIEPRIAEPSLLDPSKKVSFEPSAKLQPFSCYQYISPEQRGGYIDFLASNRSSASDIGYVFIYLYGIERRLLVDTKKPGEVGAAEHEAIIDELLRLLSVFGKTSRSAYTYITMLLLYDGTYFARKPSQEEISSIFLSDANSKRLEWHQNTEAYEAILLSRLLEVGIPWKDEDIICYAKARCARFGRFSTDATYGGVKQLFDAHNIDSPLERLIAARYAASEYKLHGGPKTPSRLSRTGRKAYAKYYPSSPSLRTLGFEVDEKVCSDIEDMDCDWTQLSNLVVKCLSSVSEFHEILSNKSFRGGENLDVDTIACMSSKGVLTRFFEELSSSTGGVMIVPMHVIAAEIEDVFKTSLSYTTKGIMTGTSQQLAIQVLASHGWQAMLPEAFEEGSLGASLSSFWKINANSNIVVFRRALEADKKSGTRRPTKIFAADEKIRTISIPESWEQPLLLGYIYSWFTKSCGDVFDANVSRLFPEKFIHKLFKKKDGLWQYGLFFGMLYATYEYPLSSHGVKECLSHVVFSDVQTCMFSICQEKFGNTIPSSALEAMEKIYSKMNIDKSLVLYDYHAGDYRMSHLNEESADEFFIDETKLASTIHETSNVHVILNDVMEESLADFDDEPFDGKNEQCENHPCDDHKAESEENGISIDAVSSIFGSADEMATEDLLLAWNTAFGTATSAEALASITAFNTNAGEDVIEIDGSSAYLNI